MVERLGRAIILNFAVHFRRIKSRGAFKVQFSETLTIRLYWVPKHFAKLPIFKVKFHLLWLYFSKLVQCNGVLYILSYNVLFITLRSNDVTVWDAEYNHRNRIRKNHIYPPLYVEPSYSAQHVKNTAAKNRQNNFKPSDVRNSCTQQYYNNE